jgi:RNA 3'-terminal phosphate cyclase
MDAAQQARRVGLLTTAEWRRVAEGLPVVVGPAYTDSMSLSASEFYEAGMSPPPEVRKDVALRLLESVESDEAFDRAAADWLHTAAAPAFDALKADPSRAIPAESVRARFEAKWSARS